MATPISNIVAYNSNAIWKTPNIGETLEVDNPDAVKSARD